MLEEHAVSLRDHAVVLVLEALDVVEADAEAPHDVGGAAGARVRGRHVLVEASSARQAATPSQSFR